MSGWLETLVSAAQFMPHGYCLAWRPDLVAMHLISDGVIAASYFSIPIGIFVFLRQRHDFPYRGVAVGFALFIVFCGLTHVFGMLTLWYPYYGLQGLMKAGTAVVSIVTAGLLIPIIPRALKLPSPRDLQDANASLSHEIEERRQAETELRELSAALHDRLQELEATKAELLSVAEKNLAAQREAEDANRSKTAFLRNVCHELRTPLNAILGFSEMLSSEIFGKLPDPRYTDYAHHIHSSGEHLLALLTNIIDLDQVSSNRRDIELESVDLSAVTDEVLEMLRARFDKKALRVHTQMPATISVVADKLAMKQVIINIVGNAEKYSQEGDEIVISTRLHDDRIEYVVTDTGIGIDEADLEKLGQVFVRGNQEMVRHSEGSGLGLALCLSLLTQMKGSISFQSALGKGTSVVISLPRAQPVLDKDTRDQFAGNAFPVPSPSPA